MNGRVFDSQLGRFLQADPLIQAPENAQSWNAYTYVFNNPYRYTDPTGMLGQTERQWLAVVVAIVYTYLTWDLEGGAAILAAAFGGMISGAIATGNMYGAMQGALIGAITAGIGVGAAAEGIGPWTELGIRAVSGGIMEVIQGGNFGHGFAAAGLTAMLMPAVGRIDNRLARTAVGAIVGGSISAATGGKFANGAISGAVQAAMSGPRDQLPATGSASEGERSEATVPENLSVEETGFHTYQEAHEAFGQKYYPQGVENKWEYQTAIVYDGKKFGYMTPGHGAANSPIVDPSKLYVAIRKLGFRVRAWSHTHYDSQVNFSGGDGQFVDSTHGTILLYGGEGPQRLDPDLLNKAARSDGYRGSDAALQYIRGVGKKGIRGSWPLECCVQ